MEKFLMLTGLSHRRVAVVATIALVAVAGSLAFGIGRDFESAPTARAASETSAAGIDTKADTPFAAVAAQIGRAHV